MSGAENAVVVEPEFTQLLTGVAGAEGPVFDTRGNFFVVAPFAEEAGKAAGQVLQVQGLTSGQASTKLVCKPNVNGDGGVPAGCQSDKQDNLYVADMRLGILKVTPAGSWSQVVTKDSEGRVLQGCNDCIFDYQGNLWVTAPAGDIAPAEYRRSEKEAFGSVYCLTTEGVAVRVDTGIMFPNGLAVRHDASGKPAQLIVAETFTKTLWGYDITGPGQVANKALWAKMPGDLEGGADGMDLDADGNLVVAHWGSGHLEVFSPQGGSPVQRIKCPFQKPSNVHFQPGTHTVYVTEHDNDGLWRFEWKTGGMPQFCEK